MVSVDMPVGQEEKDALLQLTMRIPLFKSRMNKVRIFSAVVALAALLLVVFLDTTLFKVVMAALAIFYAWYAAVGYTWFYRRSFKRMQRAVEKKQAITERHYELDAEGLTSRTQLGTTQTGWEAFELWGTYRSYVYIRRFDGGIALIDQRLLPDTERAELFAILEATGISREPHMK